jgi:hypothetical protein
MFELDSITRLPADPEALEEYLKKFPPEVIEGFAASWRRNEKPEEESEMANTLSQIISRLARNDPKHGSRNA